MEKIKIIELLNRVNNGTQPSKVKYLDNIYKWTERFRTKGYLYITPFDNFMWLLKEVDIENTENLNTEVEILEEDKKIDKLDLHIPADNSNATYNGIFMKKINEIIDYLNKENK